MSVLVAAILASLLTASSAPRDGMSLEIYDVRDLAGRVEPDDVDAGVAALRGWIEEYVSFEPEPAPRIKAVSGVIVVSGSAEAHARVNAFLARLRREVEKPLELRLQIVRLPRAQRERVVGGGQVREGEAAIEELRSTLVAGEADVLLAPRLVLLPLQRGLLTASAPFVYVRGFEVHETVYPGPARRVLAVIDEEQEGLSVECRIVPVGETTYFVECTHGTRRVRRPVETVATEHGEVAKPEVDETRVEVSAVLRPGTALFTPLGDAANQDAKTAQVLIVRLESR